jgi:DNA replication initiation complex subunit (GINS family)
MADKEINITYETLFELLRREKNREELQNLDETFFNDVAEYLKEIKESIKQQKTKQDLFAAEELKKAEIQEENIRKILRELYERREKKIMSLAMDKSRTASNIMDTSALLEQEKELYDRLVALLDRFRKGILFNLLEAETPLIDTPTIKKPSLEPEIDPEVEKEVDNVLEKELTEKKIKLTEAIPKFISEDLKEYGPFEAAETIILPSTIAELLIDKGKAEEE